VVCQIAVPLLRDNTPSSRPRPLVHSNRIVFKSVQIKNQIVAISLKHLRSLTGSFSTSEGSMPSFTSSLLNCVFPCYTCRRSSSNRAQASCYYLGQVRRRDRCVLPIIDVHHSKSKWVYLFANRYVCRFEFDFLFPRRFVRSKRKILPKLDISFKRSAGTGNSACFLDSKKYENAGECKEKEVLLP